MKKVLIIICITFFLISCKNGNNSQEIEKLKTEIKLLKTEIKTIKKRLRMIKVHQIRINDLKKVQNKEVDRLNKVVRKVYNLPR